MDDEAKIAREMMGIDNEILEDVENEESLKKVLDAYEQVCERDSDVKTARFLMKKMLEGIMRGIADETLKLQVSLVEFTTKVHRKKKMSFDQAHLQYINNVFHDVDTILACSTVDDPSRGFMTQFCNALSEYFYAPTAQSVDDESFKSIASCKDLWHRFLDYAHTDKSTPDFVLLTCIWRNTTRLCTTFRAQFIKFQPHLPSSLLQSICTTIAAQTQCLDVEQGSIEISINLIKTLRLLFKAYQSIFACFVEYITQEKYMKTIFFVGEMTENIFKKQLKLERTADDLFQAYEQLIDDILSLASKTATQTRDSYSEFLCFCQVKLKESMETPSTNVQDFFILLSLLKLYSSDQSADMQIAKDLDSVFLAYRSVMNILLSPRKSYMMEYLVEPILHLVFVAPQSTSVYKFQLQLLSYSFHENIYQQILCQLVWKNAFCSIWNEGSKFSKGGDAFIDCLFRMLSMSSPSISSDVRSALLELLATSFTAFTKSQQAKCIHGITRAVESICNDGPDHQVDANLILNFDLLYHFIGTRSANEYLSNPEFIQSYLSTSVECMGAAVDLLCQGTDGDRDLENSLWRIIDGTLLMSRAILFSVDSYSEHPQSESIAKVIGWIGPIAVRVFDLLSSATPSQKSIGIRVMESCIEIIREFLPSVKLNVDNQYISLLQSTARLVSAQKSLHFHVAASLSYLVAIQIPQEASEDNLVVANLLCEIFTKLLAYPSPWPVIALTLEAMKVFLSTSTVADTSLDCVHTLLLKHSTMLHDYFNLMNSPLSPRDNISDRLSQLLLDQDNSFQSAISALSIQDSQKVPAKRPATVDDLLQTCLAIKRFKPKKNPQVEAAFATAASALDTLLHLHSQP